MRKEIKKKKIILDTDIGPDCDDAGALAMLNIFSKQHKAEILAVTHCTSSPYGAGCVDAINKWYGNTQIPVGTLKEEAFLDEERYRKYNKFIAENYPNDFTSGKKIPDAIDLLRRSLALSKKNDVTVIAIGPLINLFGLLNSKPDINSDMNGYDLVKSKVKELVVMGGGFKEKEWNFEMDIEAALAIVDDWPTKIVFSTFEAGKDIITGKDFAGMPQDHPVKKSYQLHSPEGRSSWDLTAVWAGVMGPEPYFELSDRGQMKINNEGVSTWLDSPDGQHRYLKLKMAPSMIGRELDSFIVNDSKERG